MYFNPYGNNLHASEGCIYENDNCQATFLANCNPIDDLFESTAQANATEFAKRWNMYDDLMEGIANSIIYLEHAKAVHNVPNLEQVINKLREVMKRGKE